MKSRPVPEASWGAYRIRPRRDALLAEHEDGTLELIAEADYVVELPADAKEQAWQALDMLEPGRALLRFGNFIGESSLGGRRLVVMSNRLHPEEVEAMLDEVVTALDSLPFFFETPTQLAYTRDVLAAEDVDYQAYAFLAHALRGIGPHDLPGAFDRILARPHKRLISTTAVVPLTRADRVDGETVLGLARGISPLHRIPANAPLAGSPVANALGGRVPERVRAGRMVETTNTPENQFVVAVLDAAESIVDRFQQALRREYPLRAERQLREGAEHITMLDRWRRHSALASVPPARRILTQSTVLRSRPGYRQVTRFFVDLQARTRLLDKDDAQRLLEVRDAALIYEYWCYFQVVDALEAVLDRKPTPTRFRYGSFGSTLQRAYAADFGRTRVWFNRDFRKPRSYSIPLRPDITLELDDGTLHIFDAKFKREPMTDATLSDTIIEEEEQRATYRRGDLYKMHTYRDALGANSVWVLFPGRNTEYVHFQPEGGAANDAPAGVGALPLLPGRAEDQVRLQTVLGAMLGHSVPGD